MPNNNVALADEITLLFQESTNIVNGRKVKLRNRMVLVHQSEFDALVAGGMADTPANRGKFVGQKTVDYLKSIYRGGSARENRAEAPAVEEMD